MNETLKDMLSRALIYDNKIDVSRDKIEVYNKDNELIEEYNFKGIKKIYTQLVKAWSGL